MVPIIPRAHRSRIVSGDRNRVRSQQEGREHHSRTIQTELNEMHDDRTVVLGGQTVHNLDYNREPAAPMEDCRN